MQNRDINSTGGNIITPSGLTAAQLSGRLDSTLQQGRAPAIAIAIVHPKGTEIIVNGVRKQGNATTITANDVFMLGPVTSTMVPIILSRLIERNFFSWSSTLADLLPEFRDVMHPDHHQTTLEMLSAHISGITTKFPELDDGRLSAALTSPAVSGHEGRRRTLVSTLQRPPERTPGPGSSYRNAVNLMILAFIIEITTGDDWETVMQREVFEPFGMRHSGIGETPGLDDSATEPAQPWPHEVNSGGEKLVPLDARRRGEEPWLSCSATYPALGMYGTLPELARYLRFCLYGTVDESSSHVVSLADRERLYTLPIGGDYTPGGFDAVLPDWAKGGTVMKCEGHVSGFSTGIWIALEIGYTFFILVNVDGPAGRAARDEVYRLVVN